MKNLTDGLSIAKYLTHTQMTIGAVLLGIAVLILLIILIRSLKCTEAEIQGEYSVGPGWGPCLEESQLILKKEFFPIILKYCHSL